MKIKIGLCLFILVVPKLLFGVTDLVNVPTAEVVEYHTTEMNFRLYSTGGVVSRLIFGVLTKRLNISVSWDVDKLIGADTPTPRPPHAGLKFRIYDGSKNFPAISIGYDGQGYRYEDKTSAKGYRYKEKGIYFVGSIELLTKNLFLHFGSNINFSTNNRASAFGFIGLDYSILQNENKAVAFIAEYDNLSTKIEDNILNAALRIFAGNSLSIDLGFLDIVSTKGLNTERIIRINYQTKL